MIGTRITLISGLMLATVAPAVAAETILCQSPGVSDVVVTLSDRTFGGYTLDCIKGEFAVDLTPCAPNGAFALSAGTGDAPIVQIVKRWQDYASHIGGVTGHFATKSELYFQGGFNSTLDGYTRSWSFDVSRLTGKGVLEAVAPNFTGTTTFACAATKPKF